MGKHVATTVDNDNALYWFRASTSEQRAWKEGKAIISRVGKHALAPWCPAYVLVAGAKHHCEIDPREHTDARHTHSLYGQWDNVVYDLDKYRKRFVR